MWRWSNTGGAFQPFDGRSAKVHMRAAPLVIASAVSEPRGITTSDETLRTQEKVSGEMARHRYRGSVQLHISGRDLLALQQYHDAQVAQIRAAAAAKHAGVMANLSPGSLKLHTHLYGGLRSAFTS